MTTTAHQHGAVPAWSIGDRLRKAREHAGLEQAHLAEALGVSRNTISAAERGRATPRRSVVMAWSMATGIDLGWLETGRAPEQDNGPDGGSSGWAPRGSNPEPTVSTNAQVIALPVREQAA